MALPSWRLHPTRGEFNRLAESLQLEGEVTDAFSEQLRKLFELDAVQEQEIERLHTVVQVLTQLLVDSGVIDEQKLEQRVAAALEQQQRQAEEQRRNPQVPCARCEKPVARSATYMTGSGAVCQACYAAIEG